VFSQETHYNKTRGNLVKESAKPLLKASIENAKQSIIETLAKGNRVLIVPVKDGTRIFDVEQKEIKPKHPI